MLPATLTSVTITPTALRNSTSVTSARRENSLAQLASKGGLGNRAASARKLTYEATHFNHCSVAPQAVTRWLLSDWHPRSVVIGEHVLVHSSFVASDKGKKVFVWRQLRTSQI